MTRTNCPPLPDAVSAPRPEEGSKPLRRADGQFLYRECPLSAPPTPFQGIAGRRTEETPSVRLRPPRTALGNRAMSVARRGDLFQPGRARGPSAADARDPIRPHRKERRHDHAHEGPLRAAGRPRAVSALPLLSEPRSPHAAPRGKGRYGRRTSAETEPSNSTSSRPHDARHARGVARKKIKMWWGRRGKNFGACRCVPQGSQNFPANPGKHR